LSTDCPFAVVCLLRAPQFVHSRTLPSRLELAAYQSAYPLPLCRALQFVTLAHGRFVLGSPTRRRLFLVTTFPLCALYEHSSLFPWPRVDFSNFLLSCRRDPNTRRPLKLVKTGVVLPPIQSRES